MSRVWPPATPPGRSPEMGGSLLRLAMALLIGYGALATGLAYWQVVDAERLSTDARNPLVIAAARNAPRGAIYDVNGEVLARNVRIGGGQLQREYPQPVAAPVVGYRSIIFGTAGLERAYDAQLTGLSSGSAADDMLRKFRADPYDPADLRLSLDVRLQAAAAQQLGDARGVVVAIEPSTGRILAMLSNPTFDPNRIVDPERGSRYVARLHQRDDAPLFNRATQGTYVPGSIFKIVTAGAGLGSGAISRDTTYEDQPAEYETGFLVQGFRIRDAPRSVQTDHPLDFLEATEVSSNIWYAHASLDIGAQGLLDWAGRFGFGESIPFDLPTAASQVTGGGGPLAGFGDRVELANAAYGQGQVLVTPLQMACVAATIANAGVAMRPKLVDELRTASGHVTRFGPEAWRTVLDRADAALIAEAMQLAVEGQYGRRFAGGARIDGVPVAGKTGTAQLSQSEEPHSWFIGFAPADEPQIAIAVIVENGGSGGERAAPIGGRLMARYLEFQR
ncbi:penicillin-binding transpeptidase domain-containing protein [soil metagenome]